MNSRTYYDILGVSREATLQEITSAKNALAKVYHPDANMNQGIDTTACMQEILEAYRVLSNPESRHEYDKELGGGQIRVFRTFTVGPEDDEQAAPFVVYWNAACRLQETVDLAMEFLENNSQKKKRTFLFFRRKDAASEAENKTSEQTVCARHAVYHCPKRSRHPIPVLDRRCNELGTDPLEPPSEYGLSRTLQSLRKTSESGSLQFRTS